MTTTAIPSTEPKAPRGGPVRPSKRARWRAIVLIALHVAIVAHVLHWAITGSTLTPVEPSESMQTLETGLVNAGFVFFVVSILATLVVGRFFCGWACHVVAYQDLAAWLCAKVGVKPKPVRSRLLAWTPMFLALYMFVWPQVILAFQDFERAEWRSHFMTTRFWDTFAGPWMATLTLLVCGFVIVYWLGAKGFCTYGCPYGAFFGVADKLSPGRIRVTDACRGCRHCTDTCTSNVLVHQEVLQYGMVVDPGCMKCMDCVNVCPKDALYFGFGKPSLFAKSKAALQRATRNWAKDVPTLLVVFAIAFFWMDQDYYWLGDVARVPSWVLAIIAGLVAVALTFSGRRGTKYDFSRGEELTMAVVFLLSSQWAYRSLYSAVPHLLAIALGALTALAAISAWRLVRNRDFKLQHHQLRLDGKLTGTGWIVTLLMVGWFAFTGHSAYVQFQMRGAQHDIAAAKAVPFEQREPHFQAASEHLAAAEAAGLFDASYMQFLFGAIADARSDFAEATRRYGRAAELHPKNIDTRLRLSNAQMRNGTARDAVVTLEELIDDYPDVAEAHWRLGSFALQQRLFDAAVARLTDTVALEPQRDRAWIMLSEAEMARGNRDGAAETLYAMLRNHPEHPEATSRLRKLGLDPNVPRRQ